VTYDKWFDTDENSALIAICARKMISNMVLGVLNIALGVPAMRINTLNAGLVILGVMMLGAGVQAIKSPSLAALLVETIVTILVDLSLYNL
jgi:hypothetical protein